MAQQPERVTLAVIAREWGRIGCIGFGGPPAHIALLRRLCVHDRGWLAAGEFEDGIAAVNLLPGPASTQLAIYCAWRLRGTAGALVGGACFIVPGLAVILALAAVFFAARPPGWIAGAALGAGAAIPAVAVAAAAGLVPASWRRAQRAVSGPAPSRSARARWIVYLLAGGAAAAILGPWLVLVLIASGLAEIVIRSPGRPVPPVAGDRRAGLMLPLVAGIPATRGQVAQAARAGLGGPARLAALGRLTGLAGLAGLTALAWVAFKVGALSYGGGFVIIPLMQHDAVGTYHWMSSGQFLTAVALGQVTPGPVVQTVAVVGYAVAGVGGGLLASAIAFAPSFAFVLVGGRHFDRLRRSPAIQAFLTGAGPAAIGAIAGTAIPLGLSLTHLWQAGVLVVAGTWLLVLRRGVVPAILGGSFLGVVVFLAGGPLA